MSNDLRKNKNPFNLYDFAVAYQKYTNLRKQNKIPHYQSLTKEDCAKYLGYNRGLNSDISYVRNALENNGKATTQEIVRQVNTEQGKQMLEDCGFYNVAMDIVLKGSFDIDEFIRAYKEYKNKKLTLSMLGTIEKCKELLGYPRTFSNDFTIVSAAIRGVEKNKKIYEIVTTQENMKKLEDCGIFDDIKPSDKFSVNTFIQAYLRYKDLIATEKIIDSDFKDWAPTLKASYIGKNFPATVFTIERSIKFLGYYRAFGSDYQRVSQAYLGIAHYSKMDKEVQLPSNMKKLKEFGFKPRKAYKNKGNVSFDNDLE